MIDHVLGFISLSQLRGTWGRNAAPTGAVSTHIDSGFGVEPTFIAPFRVQLIIFRQVEASCLTSPKNVCVGGGGVSQVVNLLSYRYSPQCPWIIKLRFLGQLAHAYNVLFILSVLNTQAVRIEQYLRI